MLYIKRWLQAPLHLPHGTVQIWDRGTALGSSISPVLANLFMHYAFDLWLEREFPTLEFERYADDALIHCVSERQARRHETVTAMTGDDSSVLAALYAKPDRQSPETATKGLLTGPAWEYLERAPSALADGPYSRGWQRVAAWTGGD